MNRAEEALEQETVSRETYTHEYYLRKKFEMKVFELEKKMEELQQPKGEWITAETRDFLDGKSTINVYQCDQCGAVEWRNSSFCPNCGADMRGNDYQRHIEDLEHCIKYESTYNPEDGSM